MWTVPAIPQPPSPPSYFATDLHIKPEANLVCVVDGVMQQACERACLAGLDGRQTASSLCTLRLCTCMVRRLHYGPVLVRRRCQQD